ncbi:MAG: DUF4105 domain-containing protein [Proteobacteria bacterium]|nr:DUF4105 domain-containing protein [Pseudomonadota bacterium]
MLPHAAAILSALVLIAVLAFLPNPLILRVAVIGVVLAGAVVSVQDLRRGGMVLGAAFVATFLLWGLLRPSLDRAWDPTQAVLARASVDETGVTFTKVRSLRWRSDGFTEGYTTRRCDFDDLQGMDFIVSKFVGSDAMAHTMVSLNCGGERLIVSPEIRRRDGQTYSIFRGVMRHYELMYVVADERDAIHLRTHVRGEEMFIFPTKTTPEQLKGLLLKFADRVESLATRPRFYNTVLASCATTLAEDVQSVATEDLGLDWRVLIPGFSGEMAHELGLLEGEGLTYEELAHKHLARAGASEDEAGFSDAVRGID